MSATRAATGVNAGDPSRPTLADLLNLVIPDWTKEAVYAQIDHDSWFPEKGGTTAHVKRVCAACPVREACLNFALDHEERWGVWGGLSERERRKILRERRQRQGMAS